MQLTLGFMRGWFCATERAQMNVRPLTQDTSPANHATINTKMPDAEEEGKSQNAHTYYQTCCAHLAQHINALLVVATQGHAHTEYYAGVIVHQLAISRQNTVTSSIHTLL